MVNDAEMLTVHMVAEKFMDVILAEKQRIIIERAESLAKTFDGCLRTLCTPLDLSLISETS